MLLTYLLWGHIAGDYLTQTKKMALSKTDNSLWCFLHSAIYTICIYVFLAGIPTILKLPVINLSYLFYIFVFLSHYIIDKNSLAQKWLNLIRGRNLFEDFNSTDKYREIALIFDAIVYVVVDNGLHLMLMWYVGKLMEI